MDWGFLDIFKKADFISLMFSAAITGWIMYYFQIDSYIFGFACLASIYCITRFVVFCYQSIIRTRRIKKVNKQEQLAKEEEEKRYEENRKMEITRMFHGLLDSNKFLLASIILNGEKDPYYDNVFHFQKYSKESLDLEIAQSISEIYRDWSGSGQACISIREYQDSVVATIDPFLCGLIKQHIENKKAQ
jgi:uncharacterized membrane protein YcjF (UPF0283 family)